MTKVRQLNPESPSGGFKAYIDLVFCVDVSSSMELHIENVRRLISRLIADLPEMSDSKGIPLTDMRARIVPFASGDDKLPDTEFASVLTREGRLRGRGLKGANRFVSELVSSTAIQSDSDGLPRGLDALWRAMTSNWVNHRKSRQVIVLFSDSPPHLSGPAVADATDDAPWALPITLDGLTDLWHDPSGIGLHPAGSFLILFAPDVPPWTDIGDSWRGNVLLPSSAGEGLSDLEFNAVYEVLLNSWI